MGRYHPQVSPVKQQKGKTVAALPYHFVETAGVEPASEGAKRGASTRLVGCSFSLRAAQQTKLLRSQPSAFSQRPPGPEPLPARLSDALSQAGGPNPRRAWPPLIRQPWGTHSLRLIFALGLLTGPRGTPACCSWLLHPRRNHVVPELLSPCKRQRLHRVPSGAFRAPTRTRTWNPLIKSQLLYQLSYGRIVFRIREGGGTRTHDQRLKRPLLYQTELRPHTAAKIRKSRHQINLFLPRAQPNLFTAVAFRDQKTDALPPKHGRTQATAGTISFPAF